MATLAEIQEVMREFADIADFINIYVSEAHASDGWNIENFSDIVQHRTLTDRVEASNRLRTPDMESPVLVDPMDNQNSRMYAAVPERLYIIYNSTIVYAGTWGPMNYKPSEVKNWLQKFRKDT